MKELETRIIKIDVAAIRNTLVENGALKVKAENQINDIYDFEDGRLLAEKGYARIRTVSDILNNKEVIYITAKKMLSQGKFKEMEEYEFEGMYEVLGLKLHQSIKKYRESYQLEDGLVEIDINDTTFCPFPYIEIETDSEEKLERIVRLLGYTMEDTTSKTIYELIEENKENE